VPGSSSTSIEQYGKGRKKCKVRTILDGGPKKRREPRASEAGSKEKKKKGDRSPLPLRRTAKGEEGGVGKETGGVCSIVTRLCSLNWPSKKGKKGRGGGEKKKGSAWPEVTFDGMPPPNVEKREGEREGKKRKAGKAKSSAGSAPVSKISKKKGKKKKRGRKEKW